MQYLMGKIINKILMTADNEKIIFIYGNRNNSLAFQTYCQRGYECWFSHIHGINHLIGYKVMRIDCVVSCPDFCKKKASTRSIKFKTENGECDIEILHSGFADEEWGIRRLKNVPFGEVEIIKEDF